jgi:phage-related minor tail protein
MANGMGLMGESGAEAVVPLARTSTGDLGVKTTGGKQSTQSAGVTNVNIMALDSQSFEEFAKRNKGIFQGIVTQGLRDHKLQGEWKPLLN